MKNILLATDFSPNAQLAANFASEITRQLGGRLVVFHALAPMAKLFREEKGSVEEVNPEEEAQQKLDALAHLLHHQFGISVSRLLKPGFPEDEIVTLAAQLKPDLIVMGARGENSPAAKNLGRVAAKAIENKDIPVICIPADNLCDIAQQIRLVINHQVPLSNPIGLLLLNELNKKFTA